MPIADENPLEYVPVLADYDSNIKVVIKDVEVVQN